MHAFKVIGIHCRSCADAIKRAVREISPLAGVAVDVDRGLVEVAGILDADALRGAIEKAGFRIERQVI